MGTQMSPNILFLSMERVSSFETWVFTRLQSSERLPLKAWLKSLEVLQTVVRSLYEASDINPRDSKIHLPRRNHLRSQKEEDFASEMSSILYI